MTVREGGEQVPGEGPWPEGLRGLVSRIESGVHRAAGASWPEKWAGEAGCRAALWDDEALGEWRWMSGNNSLCPQRVSDLIEKTAEQFAENRELLLDCLVRPRKWLVLPCRDSLGDPRKLIPVYRWWCWVGEALWEACERVARSDAPGPLVEVHLARPLAARFRFLLLSEAFRHRGEQAGGWLPSSGEALPGHSAFRTIFGSDTWPVFAERARQARWTWRDHLDSHQSIAVLAQAGPQALEHEIDQLVFRDGRRPLSLCAQDLDRPASPTADDRAMLLDGLTNHLLPRFRLWPVVRSTLCPEEVPSGPPVRSRGSRSARSGPGPGTPGRAPRWARDRAGGWVRRWSPPMLAAGAVVAVVAAVVFVVLGWFQEACWAAVCGYTLVGVGALAVGPTFLLPWLMRWPAAVGLGMLAVSALNKDWWQGDLPPGRDLGGIRVPHAVLLLFGVAFGYLALEARNHGVAGWASVRRAGGVLAVGVVHALLVGLLALVVVLPAFCEDGTDLASLFAADCHDRAWTCLLSATAWGLAAGVFTQILWDDRPITAPLAHTGWRSRRDT